MRREISFIDNSSRWYDKYGKETRNHDLPASVSKRHYTFWRKSGALTRNNNLPAVLGFTGYKEWIYNNSHFRKSSMPILIYPSGKHF